MSIMMFAVPALLMELALATPVSDTMPVFDVHGSCRAATQQMTLDAGRQKLCLEDEGSARAEVEKKWSSYPAGDRTRCAAEAQLDGLPSYVDLLECLTLAREAKAEDGQ
ncbi:protein of unassigned function [Methylobacterium oryzae CBMB20]|uniref:Protein of unassigned function n=3 Tax=Methylobacterium TaxID=407 RepID=A0A089NX48_9HYPH|nr:protein of unassigned function [Methylobacterium oryzae CBMB20]